MKDILTKLVAAVGKRIPVTCKIRLLPDWQVWVTNKPCLLFSKFKDISSSRKSFQATLDLVSMIETTGVSALAVHGRTKEQRPNDPNDTEAIKKIVAHVTKVPVIANGGSSNNRNSGINTYEGLKQFWRDSGASSIMVARLVISRRARIMKQ